MSVTIAIPSGIKEPYKSLITEYIKRSNRFFKVTLFEMDCQKTNKQPPKIFTDKHIVLFDERGTAMTTKLFADYIDKKITESKDLVFVVGCHDGHPEELKDMSNKNISLSSFTLPHSMAALLVSESVYRAFTILSNHPYHRV